MCTVQRPSYVAKNGKILCLRRKKSLVGLPPAGFKSSENSPLGVTWFKNLQTRQGVLAQKANLISLKIHHTLVSYLCFGGNEWDVATSLESSFELVGATFSPSDSDRDFFLG